MLIRTHLYIHTQNTTSLSHTLSPDMAVYVQGCKRLAVLKTPQALNCKPLKVRSHRGNMEVPGSESILDKSRIQSRRKDARSHIIAELLLDSNSNTVRGLKFAAFCGLLVAAAML